MYHNYTIFTTFSLCLFFPAIFIALPAFFTKILSKINKKVAILW